MKMNHLALQLIWGALVNFEKKLLKIKYLGLKKLLGWVTHLSYIASTRSRSLRLSITIFYNTRKYSQITLACF
jgi:hypothetical protein